MTRSRRNQKMDRSRNSSAILTQFDVFLRNERYEFRVFRCVHGKIGIRGFLGRSAGVSARSSVMLVWAMVARARSALLVPPVLAVLALCPAARANGVFPASGQI